jgi:hypothetical protein
MDGQGKLYEDENVRNVLIEAETNVDINKWTQRNAVR